MSVAESTSRPSSTWTPIPEHAPTKDCEYLLNRPSGCYWCCETCNLDRHACHFCGDPLRHDNRLPNGDLNPCYACDEPGCERFMSYYDERKQWCEDHGPAGKGSQRSGGAA